VAWSGASSRSETETPFGLKGGTMDVPRAVIAGRGVWGLIDLRRRWVNACSREGLRRAPDRADAPLSLFGHRGAA
jgi:hypothetical protein